MSAERLQPARPERFFLDTNVLVYTFDQEAPLLRTKARELVEVALTTGLGVVSYQVVQEFLNVATRKFATPLTTADATLYLDQVLAPLCKVWPTVQLYRHALDIHERSGWGLYDSLVVASALTAGCRTLYTQDLQAGRSFGPVVIVDPFAG